PPCPPRPAADAAWSFLPAFGVVHGSGGGSPAQLASEGSRRRARTRTYEGEGATHGGRPRGDHRAARAPLNTSGRTKSLGSTLSVDGKTTRVRRLMAQSARTGVTSWRAITLFTWPSRSTVATSEIHPSSPASSSAARR